MKSKYYVPFTKEMIKDYTILVPNMLPVHFKLIIQVLRNYGYNIELLESDGPQIAQTGLKYVHNDTCYPAILVIGQFIDAIESGRYDPHKTALILFQTGGGCRASNYISLLRKALEKAGYGYVPVISFSLAGIEKHTGFQLTVPLLQRMIYGVMYADLILLLTNQCKPYELHKGDTEAVADRLTAELVEQMRVQGVHARMLEKNYRYIIDAFANIPMERTNKVKVGVVGEIYVKYSPLGNNGLEQFLVDEGAEVAMPGLLDFCMYTTHQYAQNTRPTLFAHIKAFVMSKVYNYLLKKQEELIRIIREDGRFRAPTPFTHTMDLIRDYMSLGCKMGEGWLLPAEMLELADMGIHNIVCTQPFGCLPNHICGKGMQKPLKERNPDMNIVAIDYDASASKVNQENRLKLMLASAAEKEFGAKVH